MQRAALISLVLVLVLGAGAWLALRGGSAPGPGKSEQPARVLAGLEAARVRSIEVANAAGPIAMLARLDVPDVWVLDARADGVRVPAQESAVRGAIRVLAELDALPAQEDHDPGEGSVDVRLTLDDGATRAVRIGGTRLGGRVACRLTGETGSKTVLAEANVVGLFRRESMEGWAEGALVPAGAGRIAEVTVTRGDARVRLIAGRRWGMMEPVVTVADADACAALVRVLTSGGRARAGRQASELDDLATLFVVRVRTESRAMKGDGVESVAVVHTVRGVDLGAGAVGAVVRAEDDAGRVLWGGWTADVGPGDLEPVLGPAGSYIARVASGVAPADVSGVRIGGPSGAWTLSVERTVDGWRESSGAALGGADAAQVRALVTLLCETQAGAATLDAVDAAAFARGAVVVGGVEAEEFEFARGRLALESGVSEVLVVRAGAVSRVYPWGVHAGLGGWLGNRGK
ncbi:MAG: hypothetical protein SFY69_11550 [Planctomycetota bacterium]|nr:hypothetical protein [Planctomycetota bacterium]